MNGVVDVDLASVGVGSHHGAHEGHHVEFLGAAVLWQLYRTKHRYRHRLDTPAGGEGQQLLLPLTVGRNDCPADHGNGTN